MVANNNGGETFTTHSGVNPTGDRGTRPPKKFGWGTDGNASCPPPKYGGDFVA